MQTTALHLNSLEIGNGRPSSQLEYLKASNPFAGVRWERCALNLASRAAEAVQGTGTPPPLAWRIDWRTRAPGDEEIWGKRKQRGAFRHVISKRKAARSDQGLSPLST